MSWLSELLSSHAKGGNIALTNGELEWSYYEVHQMMNSLKLRLRTHQIEAGVQVGLVLDHSLESIAIYLALLDMKAAVIPMDNINRAADLIRVQAIIAPVTWIIPNGYLDKLAGSDLNVLDYSDVAIAQEATDTIINTNQAMHDTLYLLTSGSTGLVKVAHISYLAVQLGGKQYAHWFKFLASDICLATVPLNHSFGLIGAMIGTLTSGGSLYIMAQPSPRRAAEAIRKSKCTILFGVPLLYNLLGQSNMIKPSDLSTVRMGICSGGPLNLDVREAYESRFIHRILQVYGSTETGAIAANHPSHKNQGTGFVLPDVDVEVSKGGQLRIKSPMLFRGYHSENGFVNPVEDGVYCSGDMGMVQDGEVYLIGRVSTFINVAGRKINPEEIKGVILQYPKVDEVLVYGKDDPLHGQLIVAEVTGDKSLSVEELFAYLRQRLARYKIPHILLLNESRLTKWKNNVMNNEKDEFNGAFPQ